MLETAIEKAAYIEEKMKQFKLVDMREQFRDIIAGAQQESLGYMDFLVRLLSAGKKGSLHAGLKCSWEKQILTRFPP